VAAKVTQIEGAIARIAHDLASSTRSWALVGGLAVSARTEPRTTRDVDVVVAVRDDADAEALTRALLGAGYILHAAIEHLTTGRLATMRLLPPSRVGGRVLVDVLFATAGIEPEVAQRADALEVIPGVVVPVATIGDLIAMKLLARDDDNRPQDAIDLRVLVRAATEKDLEVAREAADLIVSRGYHRGRDLAAALEDAVVRYRG
jgi:predicted nucleotidyltransferase